MSERKLQAMIQAKLDHADYTVADTPYEFSTGMTLNRDQIAQIQNNPGGSNIPLAEVIDNYESIEDRIKRLMADQYSLNSHTKLPLNFMLINASIHGIKSPDPYGGMSLGGTLTMPAIKAATTPIDILTPCGKYRRLLPVINHPHYYINGSPHAFCHTMSHNNVDNEYKLLGPESVLNTKLVFPTKETEGMTGGVLPSNHAELIPYARQRASLHLHEANQNSVYPVGNPTITEMLSADSKQGGALKSQYVVSIKNGNYPTEWYKEKPQDSVHIKDEGVVAPIENFALKTFHFIDSLNESRCANFKNTGIWWDMDHLKCEKIPKITAKLKFKILPIVPFHKDGEKEHIPYQNFIRHLKAELDHVDKPFS